jgi:acyl-CoA dehydrogenase
VDDATFAWPFFDESHRTLARELRAWTDEAMPPIDHADAEWSSRRLVRALGTGGWLRHAVPALDGSRPLDVRSLCIARETLARVDGLADFAFAMQGLGAGPISLFGSAALRARYLPPVESGEAIAAFAISERDAGSDVAAMRTTARQDGDAWIIDGEKTWISNGGIADHYVVFCRLAGAERQFIALVVEPSDAGFSVGDGIETIAPHPMAAIHFDGCRVPADRVVGEPGKGLRVALGTLDVFRSTVGAAALGFARRALDEAIARAGSRKLFGAPLGDLQLTQAALAEMAVDVDAAALLVYRAAWTKDQGAARVTREAAMAKLYATEAAQAVIDKAVQMFGGLGVTKGVKVEELYREIRALRIYEGASEVQKIVIARDLLKGGATTQAVRAAE